MAVLREANAAAAKAPVKKKAARGPPSEADSVATTDLPESPASGDSSAAPSMLSSGDESSDPRSRAGESGVLLPSTARAVALWRKVRRDMDSAGVLDALLSEVRRRELEGLYERDWCESATKQELPESTADPSLAAAVSTAADAAVPQIAGLAQFGLDL